MKPNFAPGEAIFVGCDLAKVTHYVCIGNGIKTFTTKFKTLNNRSSFEELLKTIHGFQLTTKKMDVLIGMEPTSVYWLPFYHFFKEHFHTYLVSTVAVHHNRNTLNLSGVKSDPIDAKNIYDLLVRGKFMQPVCRTEDKTNAYIHVKQAERYRRSSVTFILQLRTTLSIIFPELEIMIKDMRAKFFMQLLLDTPSPRLILQDSLEGFVRKWYGFNRTVTKNKLIKIYELAQSTIGITNGLDAYEIELKQHVANYNYFHQLEETHLGYAIAFVGDTIEYKLLTDIKGIGPKTASNLIAEIGNIEEYKHAKQMTKLAGLDIRVWESGKGASNKLPRISKRGKSNLRYWANQAALHLIKYPNAFRELYEKRLISSPGRGSNKRAQIAVADKFLRVAFAIMKKKEPYVEKLFDKLKKD